MSGEGETVYINLTDKQIANHRPELTLYVVNFYATLVCMPLVALNFCILVSSKQFAKQYKTLVALNVTYFIVLLGFFLEAQSRRAVIEQVLVTHTATVVNSRECIEAWSLVQIFGNFSSPLIVLMLGLERFCAVNLPTFYRNIFQAQTHKILVTVPLIATIGTITPAIISILWPTPNVKYLCGRKAAFGIPFGVFVYAFTVLVIVIALILNIAACVKALKIRQSAESMRKIKCYTGIAALSTILVSIPNFFSVINATWFTVPEAVKTPAPVLECVNCSLQFFINLSLNDEYRLRFMAIFSMGRYAPSNATKTAKISSTALQRLNSAVASAQPTKHPTL
uniref:G_PROTEIN_RECEP_F1_2 domain-containing protein n=1 Tax=Panagrellus redivivus TaxID=6233 RepID=A0A7E4URL9_PANRE